MTEIVVQESGSISFIWDDALAPLLDLGSVEMQRASHVEPTESGQWIADLSPSGGPLLGPFRLRADALLSERLWLSAEMAAPANFKG